MSGTKETKRDYTRRTFATTPLGKVEADKTYSYGHLTPNYNYKNLDKKIRTLDTYTRD